MIDQDTKMIITITLIIINKDHNHIKIMIIEVVRIDKITETEETNKTEGDTIDKIIEIDINQIEIEIAIIIVIVIENHLEVK